MPCRRQADEGSEAGPGYVAVTHIGVTVSFAYLASPDCGLNRPCSKYHPMVTSSMPGGLDADATDEGPKSARPPAVSRRKSANRSTRPTRRGRGAESRSRSSTISGCRSRWRTSSAGTPAASQCSCSRWPSRPASVLRGFGELLLLGPALGLGAVRCAQSADARRSREVRWRAVPIRLSLHLAKDRVAHGRVRGLVLRRHEECVHQEPHLRSAESVQLGDDHV